MAKLGTLPLTSFTVYQCFNVNDEGLGVLAHYPDLKQLTLRDVPARGACLSKLPHPEEMTSLTRAQSGVSDTEAKALSGMSNLQSLNLSTTALTDEAIETLCQLKALKQLTLTQTEISRRGCPTTSGCLAQLCHSR